MPGLPIRRRVAVIAVLLVIAIGTVVSVRVDRTRGSAGPPASTGDAGVRTDAQARIPPLDGSARSDLGAGAGSLTANHVPAHPADAIDGLLDARAAAVRSRDRSAWLATLLPTAAIGASARFTTAQRSLFERILTVRPLSWSYQVAGGSALAKDRRTALGGSAWLADVQLSYQLTPDGPMIHREQYLTMVPAAGGWRIAADSDGPTMRDLWDLGPLVRNQSPRCLVVGARARSRQVRQLASECGRAAVRVDAAWGFPGRVARC